MLTFTAAYATSATPTTSATLVSTDISGIPATPVSPCTGLLLSAILASPFDLAITATPATPCTPAKQRKVTSYSPQKSSPASPDMVWVSLGR